MTVSTTTTKVIYNGDGATTAFPTTFEFFDAADIEVIERVIATGAETVKALTTDYTVSGGAGSTGTVTAVTAPPATVQWVIRRVTPLTQLIDYVENDDFPAETHEKGLDLAVMRAQEREEDFSRAPKFPVSDPASSIGDLPNSVDRADLLLGFDSAGKPTAALAASKVSAFIATLLDDPDAATALSTLGVSSYIQTLVDDPNDVTARKTLGLAGFFAKNPIVNGNFDLWRNGTSFTLGASLNATAERWFGNRGAGAGTASRQAFTLGQTDVPGEPEFFYRHDQTGADIISGFTFLEHRVSDVRTFAGETVMVSYYAKADAAVSLLAPKLIQNFGAGGSALVVLSGPAPSLTTTFQKFTFSLALGSISGKTIGAGSYLQLSFEFPVNTARTVDIAQVQIELGSVATAFERRALVTESLAAAVLDDFSNTVAAFGSFNEQKYLMVGDDNTTVEAAGPIHGFKNALINGNFRVWQRGTSFTASGAYTADRWLQTWGTGGAGTSSRQAFALGQTDVPGEPEFFFRLDKTTAGTGSADLIQRIEDVRTFAGETVTLSIYLKAAVAAAYELIFNQVFGTGGSPSANSESGRKSVSVTTSWQRFTFTQAITTIAGKTLGTDGNDRLELILRGPTSVTHTLDIAQVQVERGAVQTPFDTRHITQELLLCQRYYAKTFQQATTPAQNAGLEGSLIIMGSSNGDWQFNWPHPVVMRATPSLVTYNPVALSADARNFDDATDTAVAGSINDERMSSFRPTAVDATDANDEMVLHVTADAEF